MVGLVLIISERIHAVARIRARANTRKKSWRMIQRKLYGVPLSATKMTGRPGHWSEPGEYNILFLGSILVISSQDSSALGYRELTQEGAMK